MDGRIRSIAVLSAVVFLVMMGISIISPVLPFYAEALGATPFMVGLLVGALASARVILDIPAGVAGDRFGNWRMMQVGLGLVATSSFLAVVAFNYWMLLGVRVVEGIGSALYVTSSLTALARVVPGDRRGRYMSYYVSVLLLGQVLGPSIGGAVSAIWGLRAPFAAYGIAAATGMALVAFVHLPETADRRNGRIDWGAVRSLLRNHSFIRVNIGTMAAFFVRSGILLTIAPLFLNAKLGYDEVTIGVLITIAAISSMATMVPSGIIADRRGRKLPFVTSLVLTGLVLPLFLIPTTFAGVAVVFVLYGLTIGLQGPMAAWSTDLAENSAMGTAMGVYRTISDLGFLLGPTVLTAVMGMGSLVEANDLPFFLTMVWMIVSAIICLGADDPAARHAKARRSAAEVMAE